MANLDERTWRELAEEFGFEDCHRQKVETTLLFAGRRLNLACRDLGDAIRNDPNLKRALDNLRNFRLKL
jgi:hypothetical protein